MEHNRAVIVCQHVAELNADVYYAIKKDPVDPADSGWQFQCRDAQHSEVDAQIWSVSEMLKHDPKISQIIDLPSDSLFVKSTNGSSTAIREYRYWRRYTECLKSQS
jgi:hypothetical protein